MADNAKLTCGHLMCRSLSVVVVINEVHGHKVISYCKYHLVCASVHKLVKGYKATPPAEFLVWEMMES